MTTKILVFSSNPQDTEQLQLNREFRQIEEARKDSQNKNKFTVVRVVATTVDDLQREILEEKAKIVHFCGHGLGNQGLVLETKLGQQQPVSTQAIASLFKLFANQVECVVLNACFSQLQAAVIHQHINYVIGTRNAIRDDAAITFSQGFYVGLFSGEPIERAYEFGKSNIRLKIYNNKDQERKLVPVNTEERELPEDEVFTFHIRNPLNQIISEETESPPPPTGKPSNLVYSGTKKFVGRNVQINQLHQLLHENQQVAITAIAGMGGIGKTELALQYALRHQDDYLGSVCWFKVREQDLSSQILEFAVSYLNLRPPEELESDLAKVKYCWSNWRREASLIVLDDLPNYGQDYREKIQPYLPPPEARFKVLLTSREKPGTSIQTIDLDVLTESAALELLEALISQSRIEAEPNLAKELCKWLGYLPLGLELVGRYIAIDPSLTLESTLENLKTQQLKAEELLEPEQKDMTAQLGVAAAFELSWQELKSETQRLGCYLSLFSSEPFEWTWVEKALTGDSERESTTKPSKRDLLKQKRDLLKRNLLQMSPNPELTTEYRYQLHALIAQYFRAKLEERKTAAELKQKFCQPLISIAQSIPQTPNQQQIQAVSLAIPHLSIVATELTEYIDDETIVFPFLGLGRFYSGQGIYNQAEAWSKSSLNICRHRLGEEHLYVASSLNNLAGLYESQGRYEAAEPLYQQALELYRKLLGS